MAIYSLHTLTTLCILLSSLDFSFGQWNYLDLEKAKSIVVSKKGDGGHLETLFTLDAADFSVVTTDVPNQIHGYMLSKHTFEKQFNSNGEINYEEYTYSVRYSTKYADQNDDLCISPIITSVLGFSLREVAGVYVHNVETVKLEEPLKNATAEVDSYLVYRRDATLSFATLLVPIASLKLKGFTYKKSVTARLGVTNLSNLFCQIAFDGTSKQWEDLTEEQYMNLATLVVLTPTVEPPAEPQS